VRPGANGARWHAGFVAARNGRDGNKVAVAEAVENSGGAERPVHPLSPVQTGQGEGLSHLQPDAQPLRYADIHGRGVEVHLFEVEDDLQDAVLSARHGVQLTLTGTA
jgi:hypothetical protein